MAMRVLMENNDLVNGLIYQNTEAKDYQSLVYGFSETALTKAELTLDPAKFESLCAEFM